MNGRALIALLALVTGGAESAEAQPGRRPAARLAPHSLTGLVEDVYTKRPVADLTVDLKSFWAGCTFEDKTVKTDTTGRFTFDGVPSCSSSNASMNLYVSPCERCMTVQPMTAAGREVEPRFTQADLGTIFVADEAWLVSHFATACNGLALPDTSMLAITLPVLRARIDVFTRQRRWSSRYAEHRSWTTGKVVPWPALLCLDDQVTEVGEYVKPGRAAATAPVKGYAVTTRATLIRWSDQQKFTTTVSADPPKKTAGHTIIGEWGDTNPAVLAWLKGVATTP